MDVCIGSFGPSGGAVVTTTWPAKALTSSRITTGRRLRGPAAAQPRRPHRRPRVFRPWTVAAPSMRILTCRFSDRACHIAGASAMLATGCLQPSARRSAPWTGTIFRLGSARRWPWGRHSRQPVAAAARSPMALLGALGDPRRPGDHIEPWAWRLFPPSLRDGPPNRAVPTKARAVPPCSMPPRSTDNREGQSPTDPGMEPSDQWRSTSCCGGRTGKLSGDADPRAEYHDPELCLVDGSRATTDSAISCGGGGRLPLGGGHVGVVFMAVGSWGTNGGEATPTYFGLIGRPNAAAR